MYKLLFSKIIDDDIDSSYNYLIFYNIEEDNKYVNAISFMYNKRDWINILKENMLIVNN